MKITDVMRLRIRLGLTQEQFALLLGVHQTTVSKWELGGPVRGPALKILERLQKEDDEPTGQSSAAMTGRHG